MSDATISTQEETLDPEDWGALRDLGHQMVDDMISYLEHVREQPAWQATPQDVREFLRQPLPTEPEAPGEIYREFVENILPYRMGNIHPRFWGWVIGTGTATGALAEMLGATMNPNLGGGEHVANYVEAQVLDWCKQMLGYPAEASGILVSGGSMANLVGLTVARNAHAGFDVRTEGLAASSERLTVYGSIEIHSSIQKAIELLGLGSSGLRKIPVNANFEMDITALEGALAADRAAGLRPICIIGNVGTVNTGAVDNLHAIADICAREGIWFHADGAFGAVVKLAPDSAELVSGMERADSIAFDLHKWLYMPIEIGCTLVRNEEAHRRAFSLTPDYLSHGTRGAISGEIWFNEYGLQLTRGFRALKAWMSLKEHGAAKYGRLIQQNITQTRYLANLVNQTRELELLAPAPMNIVCYRFRAPGLDQQGLNKLNQEILFQLHEQGIAVPSNTLVNGNFALRVANVNHRSRQEDFDILVRETVRIGKSLAGHP